MRTEATYEIDGRDFSTLEEFYDVISRVLIPGATWGRNLDAFNDILRGGFGTPDRGFVLRWKHSAFRGSGWAIPKLSDSCSSAWLAVTPPTEDQWARIWKPPRME